MAVKIVIIHIGEAQTRFGTDVLQRASSSPGKVNRGALACDPAHFALPRDSTFAVFVLRALAGFSKKGKNLRLIIKTGGVVDVRQRPEETNRQSLSARRRESLLEHCRRAPVNLPEQDLMGAFDCQQNIAAILSRP
jgi:hypothetical protein